MARNGIHANVLINCITVFGFGGGRILVNICFRIIIWARYIYIYIFSTTPVVIFLVDKISIFRRINKRDTSRFNSPCSKLFYATHIIYFSIFNNFILYLYILTCINDKENCIIL